MALAIQLNTCIVKFFINFQNFSLSLSHGSYRRMLDSGPFELEVLIVVKTTVYDFQCVFCLHSLFEM